MLKLLDCLVKLVEFFVLSLIYGILSCEVVRIRRVGSSEVRDVTHELRESHLRAQKAVSLLVNDIHEVLNLSHKRHQLAVNCVPDVDLDGFGAA